MRFVTVPLSSMAWARQLFLMAFSFICVALWVAVLPRTTTWLPNENTALKYVLYFVIRFVLGLKMPRGLARETEGVYVAPTFLGAHLDPPALSLVSLLELASTSHPICMWDHQLLRFDECLNRAGRNRRPLSG